MNTSLQNLREDFAVLDDWEDRYRHVIELGKALPAMDPALKTPATKVSGCASQVWIHSKPRQQGGQTYLSLVGDSDALIVKGLIAIAFMIFEPLPAQDYAATDANAIFDQLGLKEHLTPQRSNGLASMVLRLKADAARLAV
jgi:cysteine desulfuration protein SufE